MTSNTHLVEISERARAIPPSNIRDSMKRVAAATERGEVVNLAQGLPEFEAPLAVKEAAVEAILTNKNQYCDTWGHPPFRQAIAEKYRRHYAMEVDPQSEVTVTVGVSEAVNAALLSVVNPGEEVIVFEPFYENYFSNIVLCHGQVRYVRLNPPHWTFEEEELAAAFNENTRAIILSNPNNPTTRVFTKSELECIASLCIKWDALAICDEIYEHMTYDGREHIVMATIPGMAERTFTCSGLSKSYNLTGWRVGWVIAPPEYSAALRRVHDYLTLVAPTPFQIAGITAVSLPDSYYAELKTSYQSLRDSLSDALAGAGFGLIRPEGTYFIFADCKHLGLSSDEEAAEYLAREHKIVSVSGFSFFRPGSPSQALRFCFAKRPETIERACELLAARS